MVTFLLTRNWSSSWTGCQLEAGIEPVGDRPHQIPECALPRAAGDLRSRRMLSAFRTREGRRVRRLKSSIASTGACSYMNFEGDPLVEVAQRLSGNGAVTIRLELTATPARRMIAKYSSRSARPQSRS